MSIDTTKSKIQYRGNALAVNFSIPFPVTIDTVTGEYNLQALFTDTEGVDTVIPYANFEITTTVPPIPTNPYPPMSVKYPLSGAPIATGTKVTFYRVTPITQGVDLTNAGSFHATTLEMQGFDYSRIIDQEIAEDVKRAIKLPITSDQTEEEFTKELFDAKDQAVESAAEALVSEQNAKASELAAAQTLIDVNDAGATQVGLIVAQGEVTKNEVIAEGTIQIGLATDQAVIATQQATISTTKAGESANSAELAELWAIGTAIEQPLGSAKHYAELAAESALSIVDAVIFKGRVDDLAALPDINDPTTLNGSLYYVGLDGSQLYAEYIAKKLQVPHEWFHVGNTGLQDGLTLIIFNSTTGVGYNVSGLNVTFTASTVPVLLISPNNTQYIIEDALPDSNGHFTIDMTRYIIDQQESTIVGQWRCFFGNSLGSVIDSALSITSENPVKNKVITLAINAVDAKADANTAGLATKAPAGFGLGGYSETIPNWLSITGKNGMYLNEAGGDNPEGGGYFLGNVRSYSGITEIDGVVVHGAEQTNRNRYYGTIYGGVLTWRVAPREVVQTTGTSLHAVMSQKATTDAIAAVSINTRLILTNSQTFTVPMTGLYKVTIIGGGGCGGNGGGISYGGLSGTQGGTSSFNGTSAIGGHSGGGGGIAAGGGGGDCGKVEIKYLYLVKDSVIPVVIGSGGIATNGGYTGTTSGQDGSGGSKGGSDYSGGQGASKNSGSGSVFSSNANTPRSNSPSGFGASNHSSYGGGGGGSCTSHSDPNPTFSSPSGDNGFAGATILGRDLTYAKGGNGGVGAVILEFYLTP